MNKIKRLATPSLPLKLICSLAALACSPCTTALSLNEFENPPQTSKPHVWWHWMNGNVTKEGIDKDLAWLNSVGIGGIQNFNVHLDTPLVIDEPAIFLTPKWGGLLNYAANQAKDYEMEFAIAASPGWSETGGPWVAPKDGMKKLVWSETLIHSSQPRSQTVKLASPPKDTGPFLDLPIQLEMFSDPSAHSNHPPTWYEDIAVLAVPMHNYQDDLSISYDAINDINGGLNGAEQLQDGMLRTSVNVSGSKETTPYLQINFKKPEKIQSALLALPPPPMWFSAKYKPALQVSSDDLNYETIAHFPISSSAQNTITFPEVVATSVRIIFESNPGTIFRLPSSPAKGAKPPFDLSLLAGANSQQPIEVKEARFFKQPKVHRFEEKAAYAINNNYYNLEQGSFTKGTNIKKILDLSNKLEAGGVLNWRPKQGSWQIIRIGYSLTGKENHPAIPEATGLEVDKYDAKAVKRYINTYLDKYKDSLGVSRLTDIGINGVLNDSIEVGPSNWTSRMEAEFKKRRGYNLRPWLAALTGVIVNDSIQTDAFLYDYRKTLSELLTDNHYKTITKELHKRGLTHYSEALENSRPTLGDGISMRKSADIPMAAMWSFDTERQIGPMPQYWSDIREAASVAHVYGKPYVAAESLTSALAPWAFSPKDLQPMIDMEFVLGVTRPIIHTSVHQPTDKAPGLSLGIFGQFFNRLETWAHVAKPWVTYMSRSAYMLQQGRHVADIAYFYGEEAPLTALYSEKTPTDTPHFNGFDYVNAEIITEELRVEKNHLTTAGGARYKALYLGGTSNIMTLEVLESLAKLVRKGATVIGHKPSRSPSLRDDKKRFDKLSNQLWGGKTGKGRVVDTTDIQKALEEVKIAPDFSFESEQTDTKIMFLHRALPEKEIYFFTNRKNREESVILKFRSSGKRPQLWDAYTGKVRDISYSFDRQSTHIPINLRPYESGFIVFSDETKLSSFKVSESMRRAVKELNGEWETTLIPASSARKTLKLKLPAGDISLSNRPELRYFSGTAKYVKSFSISKATLDENKPLILNLGQVGDIAKIKVNGKTANILWRSPYEANIFSFLRPGNNLIEIEITNLWVNQLIGDNQENTETKAAYTTIETYYPDAPLRPSGLIGPVKIEQVVKRSPNK